MTGKLPLSDVLAAVDLGARTLWGELSAEQLSGVNFFTMNRYASWVDEDYETTAMAVLATNEYLNKHYYDLVKFPEIQWHLACMTSPGDGRILNHRWVGTKKPPAASKMANFLLTVYPQYNIKEIEMLMKKNSESDIMDLLHDMGLTDKEIKKLTC